MTVEEAIAAAEDALDAASRTFAAEHHNSLIRRANAYLKLAVVLQAERQFEADQIAAIRAASAEN